MTEINQLSNHFLIAMPNMMDPNFVRSVTYICEHNTSGAIGITITRPSGLQLQYVFEQMKIDNDDKQAGELPLLLGGPIHPDRGFVIHKPVGRWKSSLTMPDNVALTTSEDIIHALAEGGGPDEVLVALGYSAWGAEQLEQEILNNAWLTCPVDKDVIFNTPLEKRWQAAVALLGVDADSLSGEAGHA